METPEVLAARTFFADCLSRCVKADASDLHLSSGRRPILRVNGELSILEEPAVPGELIEALARGLMNERQRGVFEQEASLDIGYSAGRERFRINLFKERGRIAIAVRYLSNTIYTFDALNLPATLGKLSQLSHGLVLVCGATGSGKTSTLAAMIDAINRTRSCHIITVEDPIEILHEDEESLIHQRELYTDVPSFAGSVRAALREDPDVIMIGEMRDLDTMRAALTAAETGHLVFSTLHTGDAVGAVERLIGAFPADEQDSARHRVALVLRAVAAQHLLPTLGRRGRVPAVELLLVNRAVSHLIENAKTTQIYSTMESSRAEGMQTLEQSLADLVSQRWVDMKTARQCARDRESLEGLAETFVRTRRET